MNWRLTATTLLCEKFRRWVPILVFKDGRTHCGYFFRHAVRLRRNHRALACEGPQGCALCQAYKEDIFGRNGQE